MKRRSRQWRSRLRANRGSHDDVGWMTQIGFMVTSVLVIVPCILLMLSLVHFRPVVGDILLFQTGQSVNDTAQFHVHAYHAIKDAGQPIAVTRGARCVLRPDVMVRRGGSLIVESQGMTGPKTFLVHWQGHSTASGACNCGNEIELIVSLRALSALADVAGGFGVVRSRWAF